MNGEREEKKRESSGTRRRGSVFVGGGGRRDRVSDDVWWGTRRPVSSSSTTARTWYMRMGITQFLYAIPLFGCLPDKSLPVSAGVTRQLSNHASHRSIYILHDNRTRKEQSTGFGKGSLHHSFFWIFSGNLSSPPLIGLTQQGAVARS